MMEFAALWVMGMAKISRIAIMEAFTAFVIVMSAKACWTWPTWETIALIIHTEAIRTVTTYWLTLIRIWMERTTLIWLLCWRRWIAFKTRAGNTCAYIIRVWCWCNWRIGA